LNTPDSEKTDRGFLMEKLERGLTKEDKRGKVKKSEMMVNLNFSNLRVKRGLLNSF
jgi:hypothetical protein